MVRPFAPFLIVSLAAAVALSACTGMSTENVQPQVTVMNPKTGKPEVKNGFASIQAGNLSAFPDVPLPANHRIDLAASLVFTSPNQTIGKLVTTGPGDPNSIFHFYEKNMSAQGWSLVNAFQSSTSSMYFAKPGRFAAILIESAGWSGSRLSLNVGPE